MEYQELLKKVEKLEHDNQVLFNRIDRQQRILNELVALLEINCLEDITWVKISNHDILLKSKNHFIVGRYGEWDTLGNVVREMNEKGSGFRLTIKERYKHLPTSILPSIDRKNLYTNNCLIVVKL